MNFAVADAGIACFDAKYHFRFWRPYTAIRRAGEDGNDATDAEPEWLPLLWTPPDQPLAFLIPPIPDYPSAAAMTSAAAAAVLTAHLGDSVPFSVTSDSLAGRDPALQELLARGARSRHVARLWRHSFRPRRRRRSGGRRARWRRRRANTSAASAMTAGLRS